MAQPILVTQSTSIVQVDTSQVIFGSPAVVLLSSLNAPGTLVTIRDIAGLASTNRGVVVSTTTGVHFLDGPSCNIYTINQPYGFLTITPKTSSIWAVTNTFAFPEGSTAANVNQFTANFATISSLFANQALMSTVGISTLSTDMTQVRYNLSVGQSTIADTGYVKGAFTALSSISTAGTVYAASSLVTRDILATGHIQASCIQVQQSTGYALQVGGAAQFASTISTHRDLDVGGSISTQGNLAVGGSLSMNGGLNLTGLAITGGVSTSGTLGVARDAQFLSSLLVKDDGYFYRSVSVASNLLVDGGISTLNSLAASSISVRGQAFVGTNLSVLSSIYAGGNVSVAGDLAVAGNLIFNDVILDLNALSVFSTLTVGAFISTTGSIAAAGGLRVMGSTILEGLVSTASSMNVGGSISTTGNLAVGGSATFFSSLSVRGAVTKLGDVNIGGLLSTQSTMIVGDSIRVASNMFIGGVISSLSSINAAGTLTIGGQTFLSSGLSTIGVAAFFSSMQIQGSVSVMSSMVVRQDLTVQGTLNAAGFSLPGAAAVASLGVQTSTGVSAVFAGSTVQTGLLSTLGGIHMGGQFSTPNVITTGSTLNARFVVATSNISTQGSLGVGGDMSLSGRGTFCNLTVTSNLQTTTASSNVFSGCNIFAAAPYFSNGFNGDLTQNYSMGNVTAAGTLQVSQGATFSNQVTAQSNLNTSSLTVTGNTLMSNFTSTLGQAAFFSSVAIQGNLSVFSSVNVSCNLIVGGTLTAQNVQLPGGAILQTLAVTSNVGFTVNISSSTLHAGLFSTSGAIFSGREISTTSSILVGGIGYFQTGISTVGQAAFSSNVQVDGGLVSLSTIIGANISASKLQASSLGLGVAQSSNQFDMVGTAAIQGPSFSNTLRLTATDNSPGIALSNSAATYTLFNTKSGDAPNIAGALAILDNSNRFRMLMFPNGNTSIGSKATGAAATLDVDGLALASNMGAPLAQFSTVGAATASASTLNVLSNINVTANTGAGGVYALDITSGGDRGINVKSAGNAAIALSNTVQTTGMSLAVVANAGQYILNSGAGDSVIRADSTKLLMTTGGTNATLALSNGSVGIGTVAPATTLDVVGTVTARTSLATARGTISTLGVSSMTASTITLGTRQRTIVLVGQGTNGIAYSTDGGTTYTAIAGPSTSGRCIATNGRIIVAGGAGTNTLSYSFDGITWTGLGNSIFSTCLTIIWDGNRFIACGTGTFTLATSPDGITWTGSNPTADTNAYSIAFNGSIYMIIYINGNIYSSSNLTTWTSVKPATFLSGGSAVVWTGTRWLAAGSGNARMYSSTNNGTTWTAVSGFSSWVDTTRAIAVYGNTVVIGGDGTNTVAYSLDGGNTFTLINPASNATFYGCAWVGDRFIILGTLSSQDVIYQSFNGISWTQVGTSGSTFGTLGHGAVGFTYSTRLQETNFGLLAADSISTTGSVFAGDTLRVGASTLVANPLLQNVGINCNSPQFTLDVNGNINAGGNLYVAGTVFQGGGAVGTTLSTNRIFASTMTTSSITVTNNLTANNNTGNVIFVSGTNSTQATGQLWRSVDGTNFTQLSLSGSPARIDMVAFNGTTYAAIGTNSASNSALLWTSTDSVNWSVMAWTTTITIGTTIKWNGQYWLLGGSEGTNANRQIVLSSNLTTFSYASSGLPTGTTNDLAWNGSVWVAVMKDTSFSIGTTQNIRYSYDGLNWSNAVNGFNSGSASRGTRVVWSGTQFVAVGDDATCPIKYSYDGIVWYNSVNALSVFSNANNTTNCWGIGWNGRVFVATGQIGSLGRVGYSLDGNTWFPALTNSTFTFRGLGVGWTGNLWVATGYDSTAANYAVRTSLDGSNWTSSITTSIGTNMLLYSVGTNSNVIPDAQIGNTSFYSKQQPTFITSTNTVQLYSNAMLLNDLYTDTEGHVGINCNAPGGSALAVNGFVTMSNQAPINVVVMGTNDPTLANQMKYSLDYGQTWNSATLNPVPSAAGIQAIAWNGLSFLAAVFTSATDMSFYSSSNGVVWNSNPMLGTSNMRQVRGLCWAPPFWVATGTGQPLDTSNASIIRSLDGITWSRATSGGFASTFGAGSVTGNGQSIAFNGRRLVATGQDNFNSQIKYSDDLGATWITAYGYAQGAFQVIRTVATNGRVWLASAMFGACNAMMYSTDGANWTTTNFTLPYIFAGRLNIGIEWNGSVFVATGTNGSNSGSNGNVDKSIAYSYDGINWSWASNAFIWGADARNVVWTGRNYVAMGNWAAPASTIGTTGFWRVKTSVDGITWTNVASTQNPSWTGVGGIGSLAYSSNVYADLQVENLAIYGRNQFPFTQSTNNINLSSSNMTINNGLTIASNGFMGYATTNPRAAFDVLGGGGANNLFVTTIAGSLTGVAGMVNGYTTSALLSRPIGVAADSNQNCYFADFNNNRIRVVFSNGVVSTLAGSGTGTSVDGVGSLATFGGPHGICIDPANTNLYVTDYHTRVIRRIVIATGTVTTIAGTSGAAAALTDGTGAAARFNQPIGCVVRPDNTELYIADTGNHAIRRITLANSNVVTFAGSNISGRVDGVGTAVRFNTPVGLAITATTLYISDNQNHMLRSAVLSSSNVSTIAGSPTGGGTTGGTSNITQGTGTAAALWAPQGLALNPASNQLYIMNTGTANGTMSMYNFADNFVSVFINGGLASSINVIDGAIGTAKFNASRMLATDPTGNIYVSEDIFNSTGNRVRKITSNYTSSIAALSFDFSGGGLSHYIRSRHMPTDGRAAENAIDFFLNTSFNTLSSISTGSGNTLAASITAAGVGIGTATPCNMLHIAQDLPLSYRALNPLPAQVMIGSVSATMKLGTYYTLGQGIAGTIQVADTYWGRESAPAPLLLNPLGGAVGIGSSTLALYGPLHSESGTSNNCFIGRDTPTGNYLTIGGLGASFPNSIGVSAYNQGGGTSAIGWKNICFGLSMGTGSPGTANVGIGTADPTAPLHVQGTGSTEFRLVTTGTTTNFAPALIQMSNTSNGGCLQIAAGVFTANYGIGAGLGDSVIRTSDATKKLFLTNGGTVIGLCVSNGNVGIGTSNPVSLLQLTSDTVAGANTDIQISPVSIGNGNVGSRTTIGEITFRRAGPFYATIRCIQTGFNDALDIGFTTNNGANSNIQVERMTIKAFSGNVGIGTTAPEEALHVVGNILLNNQTVIKGKNSSGTVENCLYPRWSDNITYMDYGSGGFHLRTNIGAATAMFITNNRNVGIGLTSPQSVLDIYGGGGSNSAVGSFVMTRAEANTVNAKQQLVNAGTNATIFGVGSANVIYSYWRSGSSYYQVATVGTTFFTGQHTNMSSDPALTVDTATSLVGMIVSSSDKGYRSNRLNRDVSGIDAIFISESLPYIKLTTTDKDKAVWGVVTNFLNDDATYDKDSELYTNTGWANHDTNGGIRINGLGEGAIWVTNINGPLENGDYICSSVVPGYGRRQDDDLLHNYTVAKITMSCDFETSNTKYKTRSVTHGGKTYIAAYVGCSYHCS